MGKQKNCLLAFRIPATEKGYELVEQMRQALNKDSYKMRTLYTGKRPKGTPQATTLKKNAESIRVYIDSMLEDGTNPRINDIYENGITTGRAREQFDNEKLISDVNKEVDRIMRENFRLNKELDEQAKKIDDSPSYNSLKVERDELKKEVDSLQIKLARRESHYNAIYNSKVKEWNKTLSAKENELRTALGDIIKYKKLLEEELEEKTNVQNRSVSRTSDDIDLDRFVDDTFDKWVAQKPWYQRWLYKLGSIAWRDFAMMLFAFWTISMIVLLILKVEGVWVS